VEFGGGFAGVPQSSQPREIPARRRIKAARDCAWDMTDGEAPASLKTETVRWTTEASELAPAVTVCGAKLRIASERARAAFRIERLPKNLRENAPEREVPQGFADNGEHKRK
jgi:hypothetical protein